MHRPYETIASPENRRATFAAKRADTRKWWIFGIEVLRGSGLLAEKLSHERQVLSLLHRTSHEESEDVAAIILCVGNRCLDTG